jgi:ankyrin repeat protein
MKKRRFLLFSLLALLLTVGIPTGYLLCGYRHDQINRELIFAIKANKTNKALDALEAKADPNFRDPGDEAPSFRHYLSVLWQQLRGIKPPTPRAGLTALGLAVQQNNTQLVEALLACGARNAREMVPIPDKPGEDQGTPPSLTLLMTATKNKNPAIIQALVRHDWDVNGINDEHETALFYAENAATVKVLAACGANLNVQATYGSTTLDESLKGDEEVVEALLDLGARSKGVELGDLF